MRLGDVCKLSKVRNRDGLCTDVYSVTNSQGFIPSVDYFNKEVFSNELRSYRVVERGMLAYNPSRINVGSIALQNKADCVVVSPLYVVFSVDERRVLPEYLLSFLKCGAGLSQISANSIGTVRNNLKFEGLCNITIVLPSLEAQRRRVLHMREIDRLVRGARSQLSLLDGLVKSRFVEMFGDPDLKDRGFETAFGTDLFKIGNGKSRPASKRFNEGVPAYGGNGVSWYTDETLVDFDTIVIGRVGRHCGNTRLVEAPFWVTDNAMYIKEFKRDCFDKVFLINLMNIIGFNRFADEGDLWKISQKPFVEYEYPIPPLSLQCEFAAFAAEVDKSRFVVQQQVVKYNDVIASSGIAIIGRGELA